MPPGLTFYVLLAAPVVLWFSTQRKKRNHPFPPGPKRRPIIGNMFEFPMKEPGKVFTEWREKYGDLIFVDDLGGPYLVLNSPKAVDDLLTKRSAIYSDRARVPMFHDLMDFDWEFPSMPYSIRWREHRRMFHQFFNKRASQEFLAVQEQSARVLMHRLLANPSKFIEYLRLNVAEIMLGVVYDIGVDEYEDSYVQLVEHTALIGIDGFDPARYPVNFFPILKYLPSWFPGGRFHHDAARARKLSKDVRELPFARVVEQMKVGSSSLSVLARMLLRESQYDQSGMNTKEYAEVAKNCCAISFMAGSDTTFSALQALFMALANNPDVQKKAQEELDRVVGSSRLPNVADLEDLPYTHAIVNEILRWHVILPLGSPHRLTQDDIYEGYFIPKGTQVFCNAYTIQHDPDIYPDPYAFNPSRWLHTTPEGLKINPEILAPDFLFGAGRRKCPGRHFSKNALLIDVSHLLACFNISPLDEAGKPVDCIPETFTDAVMIYPLPFKVSISPRSEKVVTLLSEHVV